MYAVRYVSDEELPEDQAWVMVRVSGSVYLFIKESAVCPAILERAWAAYRRLAGIKRLPEQRLAPQRSLHIHQAL